MSKSKDASAAPAILDYLNRQNRPYSAIDILNNLHKEHGKTAVVKALDGLVAEGKIKSKTYNKQTVYVADQAQFPAVNEEELRTMDAQTSTLSSELSKTLDECKQLESQLDAVNNSLTTEQAEAELSKVTNECERMSVKLNGLKNQVNAVSPEERAKILKAHTLYVKEWKRRKRMCTDMLNAILEGYPKSKKELMEEVGIETDEDVGVKIPDT